MAVEGWEKFRDKFAGHEDSYAVIGGFACEILLGRAQRSFRATKDIDMILLIEDNLSKFGRIFWEFIKEGGYRCGWKNSEGLHFYRFTEPDPGYPVQIELFSRISDYHLSADLEIVPIHIDDEISSLSAIVINDDFYNLIKDGRIVVHGVSTLQPEYLIPFKMYAWIDLLEKKSKGIHVNTKDLTKHKLDVFRLLQIVTDEATVNLNGLCREAADRYMKRIVEEPPRLEQIGLDFSFDDAMERLRELYGIG